MFGYKDVSAVHQEIEDILNLDKEKHKLFLIPRGHLKSSFITIGYSIQALIKDQNKRILISNATWANARKFLSEIKGHILSDDFRAYFGDWKAQDAWNVDEITISTRTQVKKEPSISTTGLEKEITGQHYDIIIVDDIVSRENTTTPDQIKKVISYYQSLIPILEVGGELIIIGTRWHLQDLYGHIKKNLKNEFFIYEREIKENGKYIFPEKFNEHVDAKLKAMLPATFYSSQYKNKPIAASNQVIIKEYFKYYEESPKNITLINTTVDLAGSEGHDSDDTAIVTVGWTPDMDMYLLNIRFGKFSSEEKVRNIYAESRTLRPFKIGIESDAAQKYFIDLLRLYENMNYEQLPIEKIKTGGKMKEERIGNLEPLYRNGKVYHPKNAPWLEALEEQLLSFTFQGTHGKDDITDALSSQLQLIDTPIEYTSVKKSWAELNKNEKKDLTFWSNAVLWETEAYNEKKKKLEEDLADEIFFDDIIGFDNYSEDIF